MDKLAPPSSSSRNFEITSSNSTSLSNDVDINKPEALSKFLEMDAFGQNSNFVVAQQNECAQLKPGDKGRILLFPHISLCLGIAFHSRETDTWYALHATLNDRSGPIDSFHHISTESNGFECDKLVLINAPDVVGNRRLRENDTDQIARGMLGLAGGSFEGQTTHIGCSFTKSFDTRRSSINDEERRQIMLVPEAHSIYLFSENGQHLSTHEIN
jgi:hypothetical protein